MERIGFGLRLGAAIIDMIILCIAAFILTSVFGISMAPNFIGADPDAAMGAVMGGFVLLYAFALAYSSLEIFKAATPGKMALKLRIANQDGSAASQDVLGKRWAIKNSSSILSLLAAITTMGIISTLATIAGLVVFVGCLMVLGADRQALHDKVAKTAVFRNQ